MKMNPFIQWVEQQAHSNLFYLIFFFLFLMLVKKFSRSETNKCKLPPSPSKLPIIGNLHQIHGSLHHAFKSLAQKHGPLMLLHFGSKPTLVVSSAEIALDVMKTYDHVFSSRPQLQFPTRLFYGKNISFAPYGEYWRELRKVCVFQLVNSQKVQSFRFVREEEVTLMMDRIKDAASASASVSTSLVNLSEMFNSLTNDVVCRVALGRKYNEGEAGKKFKDILKEFMYLVNVFNVGDLIPSLTWVNNLNGLNARVDKNFRDIDSFMNQVVEEHIEKKRSTLGGHGNGDNEEEDFVDVMLGIEKGDNEHGFSTKAIILDMLIAGTVTSSIVMEWAMSELIRHPNVMEEVQKEVRDIARGKLTLNETDINEMHYIKSVIKETLRLHPPLPLLVPRETMQKIKIQGYDIPDKTQVMINVFQIGRDPKLWDEPEKFWPKRFLNGASASIDFKGQDFQFIPFGAGRRGCPGSVFAIPIIELALANLLNRFDWALPKGMNCKDLDMEEAPGITVHRKNELVLIAKWHYS